MKLYDFAMAPNSRRVRIFIAEKNIEVPVEQIDLLSGENLEEKHREKNGKEACLNQQTIVSYDLLGKIYNLIEETKTNTVADKEKRDWLLSECRKRNLRHNMKPSFIQLITKLVF